MIRKTRLYTPGPTPLLPAAQFAMAAADIHHRTPEFRALYQSWIAGNRRGNGGDLTRLYAFILNIKHCLADGVAGDFAELGVWRGNSAAVLAHFAALSDRRVYLFDTFTGFDARDLRDVDGAAL